MLELKDGFVLYHGSFCEVKEPDLAKCAKKKDFGQGFYLTTSKEQAESLNSKVEIYPNFCPSSIVPFAIALAIEVLRKLSACSLDVVK